MNGSDYGFGSSWETGNQVDLSQTSTGLELQSAFAVDPDAQQNNGQLSRPPIIHHRNQAWKVAQASQTLPAANAVRTLRSFSMPLKSNDQSRSFGDEYHRSCNIDYPRPLNDDLCRSINNQQIISNKKRRTGLTAQRPLPSIPCYDVSPSQPVTAVQTTSRASSQSLRRESHSGAVMGNPVKQSMHPHYVVSQDPLIDHGIAVPHMRLVNTLHPGQTNAAYLPHTFQDHLNPNCWSFDTGPADTGYYGYPVSYEIDSQGSALFPTPNRPFEDHQQRSFSLREPLPASTAKRPTRKHFTPEVTNILKTWFKENSTRPYPSEETKQELLAQTGLTMNQLSNWFINARRRNWRKSTRLSRE